jgi:hypothetical protein
MLKPSCSLATRFVFIFLVYNKGDSLFPAVLWSLHCPSEPSHTKIFVTRQKFLFQNFSNKFWLSQKWDREGFYVVSQLYFYSSEKRRLDVDADNTALWCFIFLSSFVVLRLQFLLFPSFILYLFLPILLSFVFLPFAFHFLFHYSFIFLRLLFFFLVYCLLFIPL